MEDKRISGAQEKLEDAMSKIQDLHIQATAGNITRILESINDLQIVYNTLTILQEEQKKAAVKDDGGENGRETNTK